MRLNTDDYIPVAEAARLAGMSESTGRRLAKHLGVVHEFFGVFIVKKSDVETLRQNRKPMGNPDWIASQEEAAAAALRAVESRMRRIERDGMTAAELARGKKRKKK